ncbi:TlpA family protein disulfide reductase [Candidatus Pelagibacter sp.]|jgi:thiol-disulfide isomerase/thioredoxin|nr:TlpA family protein disulfide reductase [Candidatus Pelagibacter sp.]
MRILILFTFLITNALANELPDFKNLVVHKIPKTYDNVIFLDDTDEEIDIQNLDSQLIILNFWATWCEPCKEEMPSLNRLQASKKVKNLKIYPINIGKENLNKVNSFFAELGIDNLEPYFDNPSTLAKTFSLRGVPTTIFLNSKGEEFARIIGSINFDDENFISWLKNSS